VRITANIAILALLAIPCYPEKRQNSKRSVPIYVDLRANVPIWTLMYAESLASRMFEKAGVSVRWPRRRSKAYGMEQSITVRITSNTPRTFHPGALAYAEPCADQFKGVQIRVFFDQIESSGTSKLVPYLLAHVLVHEITHVLQGIEHHSEEGVMKARWTADDIYQMLDRPLPFDPFDVKLIRRGLANRDRASISAHLGNRRVAELAAAQ
jgi:hypothetical protein